MNDGKSTVVRLPKEEAALNADPALLERFARLASGIADAIEALAKSEHHQWWHEVAHDSHDLTALYRQIWRPGGLAADDCPPFELHLFCRSRKGKPVPPYVQPPRRYRTEAWMASYSRANGVRRVRNAKVVIDGAYGKIALDPAPVVLCLRTWVDHAEAHRPAPSSTAHDPQATGEAAAAESGRNRRSATVNDRMKAELATNLETVKGWTARQWAQELNCAKSTVTETEVWKALQLAREEARAERRSDRRRK